MANAPELSGYTLPYPTVGNYSIDYVLRGAANEMADGSIVIDIVNDPGGLYYRRVWKMGWRNISKTNADTILTAYYTLIANGTSTFRPVDTATTPVITVTPTKTVKAEINLKAIIGTTHYYDIDIEVKEHY